MKWNRIVNNYGRLGCNVVMDLVLEYDNYLFKDMIRGLGVNISEVSVRRICRVFFIIKVFFEYFDLEMSVKKILGEYCKKFVK